MRRPLAIVLMAAALVAGACAGGNAAGNDKADKGPRQPPTTPAPTTTTIADRPNAFGGPGPYVAGVTTLSLPDRKVEVWYPAPRGSEGGRPKASYDVREPLPPELGRPVPDSPDLHFEEPAWRDLPLGGRPGERFPVVLFSHGYGGWRNDYSSLLSGVASWGFVVVAPDHLERGRASLVGRAGIPGGSDLGDLSATLDLLGAQDGQVGGRFAGRLDLGQVAVAGHSSGADAAVRFGADPRVGAVVAWASALPPAPGRPPKPTLLVAAGQDYSAGPGPGRAIYNALPPPKRLAVIDQAGHGSWTDACVAIRAAGGSVDGPKQLGVPIPAGLLRLSENGCQPTDPPPDLVWSAIQHLTVAHLRSAFGIDRNPIGLDQGVRTAFPGLTIQLQQTG